jgi:hypothetical protein
LVIIDIDAASIALIAGRQHVLLLIASAVFRRRNVAMQCGTRFTHLLVNCGRRHGHAEQTRRITQIVGVAHKSHWSRNVTVVYCKVVVFIYGRCHVLGAMKRDHGNFAAANDVPEHAEQTRSYPSVLRASS